MIETSTLYWVLFREYSISEAELSGNKKKKNKKPGFS